jgi:hypothetical protein
MDEPPAGCLRASNSLKIFTSKTFVKAPRPLTPSWAEAEEHIRGLETFYTWMHGSPSDEIYASHPANIAV